ncbi:MAG: tetratricopeptide repeat protein [Paenibacillaceae bacterium]|nr:tetratricopeptide repeat protein [Paenibacillaceae bacterium]
MKIVEEMRKIFPFLAFIFIISIMLTGCHKKTVTLADDTWYIVDNNWILMLCEEAEQENYKGLVSQLKGNGDVLKTVIEQFQGMERDAKTENALGVAYLRLRRFDDAERHLKAALDLSVTEEEKACALTNLSECCLYQDKIDEVDRYAEEAYEKDISDPVKRLILDSNMLKKRYLNSEISYKQVIKTAKKLIKQEKNY